MSSNAASLSTVVRLDAASMPSNNHAVESPVPEPSSKKRPPVLLAANVRNSEQVCGSEGMVKPAVWVSAQRAWITSGVCVDSDRCILNILVFIKHLLLSFPRDVIGCWPIKKRLNEPLFCRCQELSLGFFFGRCRRCCFSLFLGRAAVKAHKHG